MIADDVLLKQGCLDIWIDEIVPCLRDTETGEIKETVVFKIESLKCYAHVFRAIFFKDFVQAFIDFAVFFIRRYKKNIERRVLVFARQVVDKPFICAVFFHV